MLRMRSTPQLGSHRTRSISERAAAQRVGARSTGIGKVIGEIAAVTAIFIAFHNWSASTVHRYEPLRCSAKDDWVLAAPAVRIAVFVGFSEEQNAAVAHELNNARIRFKHTLTCKVFNFGCEVSGIINGAIDFETVPLTKYKVVVTVTRRSVDAACSRLPVFLGSRASRTSAPLPRRLRLRA